MHAVTHDPSSRTWLLSTPETGYALRLDGDDVPVHLHWGPPLTLEQAVSLPAAAGPRSSFEGVGARDELVTEAGARFGTPSLQLAFPDGVRGVDWRYAGHAIDGDQLRIDFTDAHEPVEIALHYRIRGAVIERWTRLVSAVPVKVLRCDSAAWSVPVLGSYRLSHAVGDWSAENRVERGVLASGETTLTSRRGMTGHAANPWLMLDAGDATEAHGEVWSAALAWSGSWRITATRDPAGRAGWTGGFGHEGLVWELSAGESFETPVFAGVYS
ncbi:MAG: alpha-galactosidase, partial [Catenulispora sp.]|nr:alpha-galactosidase [Catenulispora sp.]